MSKIIFFILSPIDVIYSLIWAFFWDKVRNFKTKLSGSNQLEKINMFFPRVDMCLPSPSGYPPIHSLSLTLPSDFATERERMRQKGDNQTGSAWKFPRKHWLPHVAFKTTFLLGACPDADIQIKIHEEESSSIPFTMSSFKPILRIHMQICDNKRWPLLNGHSKRENC